MKKAKNGRGKKKMYSPSPSFHVSGVLREEVRGNALKQQRTAQSFFFYSPPSPPSPPPFFRDLFVMSFLLQLTLLVIPHGTRREELGFTTGIRKLTNAS